MGKAGQSLRQALDVHGISQNQLAVALRVDRSMIFKWYHERRDPTAETVVQIAEALKSINPEAAAEFIWLYVGDFLKDSDFLKNQVQPPPGTQVPGSQIKSSSED
jgi:transcriptional regulator with XRE-family HTH domain